MRKKSAGKLRVFPCCKCGKETVTLRKRSDLVCTECIYKLKRDRQINRKEGMIKRIG